jgi:hypothetical protein
MILSYLRAGRMSEVIIPVNLEPQVIVGMDHFVCQSILEMSLILHFIRTE